MKVGLLTSSLTTLDGDEVIARAGAIGLDSVELAAWPRPLPRPHTAAHVDTRGSALAAAARLRTVLDRHGVEVSALACYDNPLHPQDGARARAHLGRLIEVAGALRCMLVGTFVGRDPRLTIEQNLEAAGEMYGPLVRRATELGVRIMIENCPMHGWDPDGRPSNLAYSPELWEWMEEIGLWLNFDPSHLPPLGIDPLQALESHLHRVVHVHAKDVVISPAARNRVSCYGQVRGRDNPWDTGWWSHRLPGDGELDWPRLVATLADGGFDGAISIEHEDVRGDGTPDTIFADVARSATFIRGLADR